MGAITARAVGRMPCLKGTSGSHEQMRMSEFASQIFTFPEIDTDISTPVSFLRAISELSVETVDFVSEAIAFGSAYGEVEAGVVTVSSRIGDAAPCLFCKEGFVGDLVAETEVAERADCSARGDGCAYAGWMVMGRMSLLLRIVSDSCGCVMKNDEGVRVEEAEFDDD